MREASSRVIMENLWELAATVTAYDPVAMKETHHIYGDRQDLNYSDNRKDALLNADALIIVTKCKPSRALIFLLSRRA